MKIEITRFIGVFEDNKKFHARTEDKKLEFLQGNVVIDKDSYHWLFANFRNKFRPGESLYTGPSNPAIVGDPERDEGMCLLDHFSGKLFLPYSFQISSVYKASKGKNCRIGIYINWETHRHGVQRGELVKHGMLEYFYAELSFWEQQKLKFLNRTFIFQQKPLESLTVIVLLFTLLINTFALNKEHSIKIINQFPEEFTREEESNGAESNVDSVSTMSPEIVNDVDSISVQ